jgi:hypothetical protein
MIEPSRNGKNGSGRASRQPPTTSVARAGDPFAPFVTVLSDVSDAALFRAARDFVDLQPGFPPPSAWEDGGGLLRWLPVRRSDSTDDPRWSFAIRQTRHRQGQVERPRGRTLVLLACIVLSTSKGDFVAYGLGGLRVVLHVGEGVSDRHEVLITSAVSNIPPHLFDPQLRIVETQLRPAIEKLSGDAVVQGVNMKLRFDPESGLEASADQAASGAHASAIRTFYRWQQKTDAWEKTGREELRSGLIAKVVRRDPSTRFGLLKDVRPHDASRHAKVFQSASLSGDARIDAPAPTHLSGPLQGQLRADAVARRSKDSAAWQGERFFELLDEYGLPWQDILKFAPGTLQLTTFSQVGHSKDGDTINADVQQRELLPLPTGFGTPVPSLPGARYLQVRFALAERHSSAATALGISCDPRWVWHEFAHVLIFGLTGEMEFAFAHSVGDGLAAIRFDPDSALRRDPVWRGATFPWVRTYRRHDREAARGWSWSGTMFRYPPSARPGHSEHFGYWAEQVMSTTLFNIYRCLGGDTAVARSAARADTRMAAAELTSYLVICAIRNLGPAVAQTYPGADDFATAMIEADVLSPGLWLPLAKQDRLRLAGVAGKAIRWCFERQGLYADPTASPPNDGPGMPPAVDVYVGSDGDYLRPRHPAAPAPSDMQPRETMSLPFVWTLETGGTWQLSVSVPIGNRGGAKATNCDVHAWLAFAGDVDGLDWDPNAWPGNTTADWHPYRLLKTLDIEAGASAVVDGVFTGIDPAHKTKCLLLVAITCQHDRTIIDKSASLPCAQEAGPVLALLRGDNNLALFRGRDP